MENRHFINLKLFGLAALMSPMLVSCVYDSYLEDTVDGREGVEINLQIVAGGMSTRSSSHTIVTKGEEYEAAINVPGGDFAIFIFDGDGKYLDRFEPGQILVKDMATTTVSGVEMYSYSISGVFQPEEDVTNVQMLILANWKTFGGDYNTIEEDFKSHPGVSSGAGSDLNYFFSSEAAHEFAYSDFTDGTTSWSPQSKPGIPMTALSGVYSVTQTIDLGPVTALRGLAKIEVVDVAPKDGAKISECKLSGFNNAARFAPVVSADVNPGWNSQPTLVSTPSLAKGGQDYKTTPLSYVGSTREVIPNKETEKQVRNVYSFYVPEMLLEDGKRPTININVAGSTKTFEIQLANYNGDGKPALNAAGTPDYFDHLLRNHLYRFNVLSVGVDAELTLKIDTDFWDNDEDEYFYDDMAVTFAPGKAFEWDWDFDNVDPLDPKFEEIGAPTYDEIMNSWSRDKLRDEWKSNILMIQKSENSGAFGSFTITAPERGTWTLALYCEESTPNHWFYIEVWDEATGTWVREDQRVDPDNEHNFIADTLTGEIARKGETAKEVKIRIVPKELQSVAPYKARLVMNVTTFDGRMAEVNLLTGKMYPAGTPDSAKQYYYIIQYPIANQ